MEDGENIAIVIICCYIIIMHLLLHLFVFTGCPVIELYCCCKYCHVVWPRRILLRRSVRFLDVNPSNLTFRADKSLVRNRTRIRLTGFCIELEISPKLAAIRMLVTKLRFEMIKLDNAPHIYRGIAYRIESGVSQTALQNYRTDVSFRSIKKDRAWIVLYWF